MSCSFCHQANTKGPLGHRGTRPPVKIAMLCTCRDFIKMFPDMKLIRWQTNAICTSNLVFAISKYKVSARVWVSGWVWVEPEQVCPMIILPLPPCYDRNGRTVQRRIGGYPPPPSPHDGTRVGGLYPDTPRRSCREGSCCCTAFAWSASQAGYPHYSLALAGITSACLQGQIPWPSSPTDKWDLQ